MMKSIRCIKISRPLHITGGFTIDAVPHITIGKIYEEEESLLITKFDEAYYIKFDDGLYRYYYIDCFIDIQEERDNKLNELCI